MKKKMQQWAALCLALALAFCLGLPVWAEDPETYGITSEQKGRIILDWKEGGFREKRGHCNGLSGHLGGL